MEKSGPDCGFLVEKSWISVDFSRVDCGFCVEKLGGSVDNSVAFVENAAWGCGELVEK